MTGRMLEAEELCQEVPNPFFSLVAAYPRLAAADAYGNYRVGVATTDLACFAIPSL